MAEIKRHEIKYIISLREAELLKYRLRALLRPDPHVRADGSYFIRSLYFDDTDYRRLSREDRGRKGRTKYRIRFYNMDDSRITLEKKSKDGDFSGKESVRISRELAEAFLTGGEELRDTEELARELARLRQNGWKPAVLVDYVRYPFVYPTATSASRSTRSFVPRRSKPTFSTTGALTVPVLDEGEAVLEVKYDAFLPAPVRALLEGVTKQRCSRFQVHQMLRHSGIKRGKNQ